MTGSLTRRLVAVLALLLLAWGLFVAMLASRIAHEQGQETLQRLSHGLATHIVEHWPVLGAGGEDDPRARSELLRMLMTVNPGIQVYLLDATGRVETYIGEPGMVREHQVDMDPVGRFLAGAALPLYGTDPMRPGAKRVFSVSRFPSRAGEAQSSAYLYIVLDGEARNLVASQLSQERIWKGVAWAAVAGMAMLLIVGALAVRRLTRPLQRLAAEMSAFELQGGAALAVRNRWDGRDEVEALGQSFQGMARRIAEQHEMQQKQSTAHREVIANVAHDLRTPLTALHGHLEALRAGFQDSGNTVRHLDTAIAQSDKLRRLIQQLFELATLQSMEQPVQGERFRFDEVVADAVQKFEVLAGPRRVALTGPRREPWRWRATCI